jgi:hypothetical protein
MLPHLSCPRNQDPGSSQFIHLDCAWSTIRFWDRASLTTLIICHRYHPSEVPVSLYGRRALSATGRTCFKKNKRPTSVSEIRQLDNLRLALLKNSRLATFNSSTLCEAASSYRLALLCRMRKFPGGWYPNGPTDHGPGYTPSPNARLDLPPVVQPLGWTLLTSQTKPRAKRCTSILDYDAIYTHANDGGLDLAVVHRN